MEKKIKEAMEHVRIPEERKEEMFREIYAEPESSRGQKKHWSRGQAAWIGTAAAALLAVVLFRGPIETLARQLLFPAKDSVTGENGIQSVDIGEMGVTRLEKPEDMIPIESEELNIQSKDWALETELRSKMIGSRKQYESLGDMEEDLGIAFLHSKALEEEPFWANLCIYDQEGLSTAIADSKFFYGEGEAKTKICMEIVMELENNEKGYRYGMNQEAEYQGIYEREDGLFKAVLLQNNTSMGKNWNQWIVSDNGGLSVEHLFGYFAPLNTYEAVFCYDGIRYDIYGAESPEMLKEILESLA